MVYITTLKLMCPLLFQKFITDYQKVYPNEAEYNIRKEIFCSNYEYIETHNSKNDVSYQLDINEYADFTDMEFKQMFTSPFSLNDVENNNVDDTLYKGETPESWDWREKGHVSVVKNQGKCGSCWSFSTTGSIESHLSIYKNLSILLSEQELVDCSWMYANMGCSGGMVDRAFRYVKRFGLVTEDEYPYDAKNHVCKLNIVQQSTRYYVSGWADVQPFNETRLTETLYNRGPVSIAIDASSKEFRFYKSGVFDTCGVDLDHAVLIVGYGVENGKKYYIIKNSWGDTYGDKGYIKLSRGERELGTCGLAMMPSFPLV